MIHFTIHENSVASVLILTVAYNLIFKVLPSLREKHDEFMLLELVKWWKNYKIMIRWLSFLSYYLDIYFISGKCLPSLSEVGLSCFHELVSIYLIKEIITSLDLSVENETLFF